MTGESHLQVLERLEAADDPERAVLEATLALLETQDVDLAHAVRVCAIPKRLNPEVVGVLIGRPGEHAENVALLERVARMSFVIRREDGDLVYHDNVRDILLDDWRRSRNRNEFAALAHALVDLYETKHNAFADLERSLLRVSSVIRRANDERYVQLTRALESRLLSPLHDALYYATLITIEDGYTLFGKYVESYESAGRIGVCRALVGALRDQLERSDAPEAASRLIWLRYWDGRLARDAGDPESAEEIYRSIDPGDDARLRTWLLSDLASTLSERDRYAEARVIYEEELELAKATMVDPWNLTVSYQRLGELAWTVDDLPRAQEYYQLAAATAADNANVPAEAYASLHLSGVLAQLGEFEEALAKALHGLDLARTGAELLRPLQRAAAVRFMYLFATFEPRLVQTLRTEAYSVQPSQDEVEAVTFEVNFLGALREARRSLSADEVFELARRPVKDVVGPSIMNGVRIEQALHAEALGDYAHAIAALTEVLKDREVSIYQRGLALTGRGGAFAATGSWREARRDLEAALLTWQEMGNDPMVTTAHVFLARVDVETGRLDDAEARLEEWRAHAEALAPSLVAIYHATHGLLLQARGKLDQAEGANRRRFEALQQSRRLEAGSAAADLSLVAALRGDWAAATEWAGRSVEIWREVHSAASYQPSRNERAADRRNGDAVRIYCSPDRDLIASRDLLLSAIELVPTNMWYSLNLAYVLAALGEWGGAADAADRAYANAPLQLPPILQLFANYRVMQAYELLARGAPAEALAVCRGSIERIDDGAAVGPALALLRQATGDAERQLGRLNAAAAEYRAASELSGHHPRVRGSALIRLAAAEVESREVDATAALLREAVEAFAESGDGDAWWSTVAEVASAAQDGRLGEAVHRVFRELVEGDRVTTFSSEIATPLPPGWAVQESMTLTAPDGVSNLMVSGDQLEASKTAREYADEALTHLQGLNQFEEVSFEPVELPAQVEAYVRRFTWVTEDDVSVSQCQAYFVVGDRAYVATGTTIKGAAELEEQLVQLVRTIAVRKPEPERS